MMRRAGTTHPAVIGLAGLILVGLGSASAHAEIPSEALRLQRALEEVNGLHADFVQIREVSLTGESVEAAGSLAFRPPQAFRLAYITPEPQELVIAGDSLWVVMPSENQVQLYPFSVEAPGSEIFLLFGAKDRSLTSVFEVVQEPWAGYEKALLLTPRDVEPGYPLQEIRLIVGKDGFPYKLFFREITGDTVIFTFTRVRKNPENIDELVKLELPEGIEVIEVLPPSHSGGLPIDRDR